MVKEYIEGNMCGAFTDYFVVIYSFSDLILCVIFLFLLLVVSFN